MVGLAASLRRSRRPQVSLSVPTGRLGTAARFEGQPQHNRDAALLPNCLLSALTGRRLDACPSMASSPFRPAGQWRCRRVCAASTGWTALEPRSRSRNEDGVIEVRPLVAIPASQAWFWTPEWQAREREVDQDVSAAQVRTHEGVDALLVHLDTLDCSDNTSPGTGTISPAS